MNKKEKEQERDDLNILALGKLTQSGAGVLRVKGLPAYIITISPIVNLIVIPGKEANKVVLIDGPRTERLKDMKDDELVDFVRFYNKK